MYRAGINCRADYITTSQYEMSSFATKQNLYEAATDALL